ncbi:hypothetical protein Ddye_012695 [Dipteronia dyeriana]|uniref:Uncharacterized protein n=1 Tax=Dipteronia dyeriana TaxID=168575 RepID=A0AAE0CIY1_9ROSI|nr:hypothetical protein Ddye_012695 [Dipteronia dyeriana]
MEYELFIFNGVPSPMKLNLLYKQIFERLLFWGNIFKRILIDEGVRIADAEVVHRMGVSSKSRKEMGECGCIEPLSKTIDTYVVCGKHMVVAGACVHLQKLVKMDIEGAKKLLDSLGRGKIWGVFAGA